METDRRWHTLTLTIKSAVLALFLIAGTLLGGGAASADMAKEQYCRAVTVSAAPVRSMPSDDAPARYVLPPGTSLWVVRPAVNNYLRVPETPPYPSRSGWIRENHVRMVTCASADSLHHRPAI